MNWPDEDTKWYQDPMWVVVLIFLGGVTGFTWWWFGPWR